MSAGTDVGVESSAWKYGPHESAILWCSNAVTLWRCDAAILWHCNVVTRWHWFRNTVTPRHCMLWHCDAGVLQHCDEELYATVFVRGFTPQCDSNGIVRLGWVCQPSADPRFQPAIKLSNNFTWSTFEFSNNLQGVIILSLCHEESLAIGVTLYNKPGR